MCGSEKGGPTRKSGVLVAGQVKKGGGGLYHGTYICTGHTCECPPPPPGFTCIIVHDLSASTVTSQDNNGLDFVDRHYVDYKTQQINGGSLCRENIHVVLLNHQ